MPTNLCLEVIDNTTFKVDEIEGAGATDLPVLWGTNNAMPEGPSPTTTTGEFEVLGTTFTATGERGQFSTDSAIPAYVETVLNEIEIWADQACTQRPTGSISRVYAQLNRTFSFAQGKSYGGMNEMDITCAGDVGSGAYGINWNAFESEQFNTPLTPGVYELNAAGPSDVTNLQTSFGEPSRPVPVPTANNKSLVWAKSPVDNKYYLAVKDTSNNTITFIEDDGGIYVDVFEKPQDAAFGIRFGVYEGETYLTVTNEETQVSGSRAGSNPTAELSTLLLPGYDNPDYPFNFIIVVDDVFVMQLTIPENDSDFTQNFVLQTVES